jgi:EAL domain-containing protein (putative c-di-GMP-specific phosphodiesterase class I)
MSVEPRSYSSLAYLKRFPVDVLEVDHSFVHDLGKDPEDSAIVAAVVSLADAMGFNVIAEGVETDLQRDCLVALGCTRAQGYLFARPVEAAEAESALDHAAGRFPGQGRDAGNAFDDEPAVASGRCA